jgi:hypothetical protein
MADVVIGTKVRMPPGQATAKDGETKAKNEENNRKSH